MFGSPNPFGQSSSPFGSQSVFGQTSNTSTNPFAPKPFGSTTPFGSQTGSSMFGGTATGMFGAPQTSSPFSSNTTFGASSSPAFGSSMPAFGASSTPAFGASSSPAFGATTSAFGSSSSSAFGASSVFGQKPAFGGFGSSQTSPFGSTSQPSQPAFGGSLFGSTSPFGAAGQSAFGATSTAPAFGATSSPAFGATSTPAFGATSTPAFGATSTPAFGATTTPAFGSTGSAFGASSTPVFGSSSSSIFGSSTTPAFGASSSPAFGASSTPAFGVSTTPAFGASTTPAFGASTAPAFVASTTPSFSFSSGTTFGQSASTFSSSPFVTTTSQFGTQSSLFGSQTTPSPFGSPGFGQLAFGGQRGGSRVAPYTATNETEGSGGQPGKLESISAMPVYKEKSHDELRWEDYQLGDKGGPHPPNQSSGGIGFSASTSQANPFTSSPAFPQSSAPAPSNPFAPKPSPFAVSNTSAFGTTAFSASSSSSPFTSTPGFGTATSAFTGSTPSLFSTSTSNAFASTPSLFSSSTQATSSPFSSGVSFTNTQPSLFQTTATSLGQTGFGPSTTPSFQSNMYSTPSTGFSAGLFSSGASQVPSSSSMFSQQTSQPFQLSQPLQPANLFSFCNLGQTQSGNIGVSSIFSQSTPGQLPTTQNVAIQPLPATNPFGTLPAMPQMSIGRTGTSPSVQYGISSLPVVDKPAPVRISSLLTSRHLLQRRIRLPARKYRPKHDGAKVPFFSDEEETSSTPKADALFIPRENPRALVIRPTDQVPLRASVEKVSPLKDTTTLVRENGKTSEAGDFSLLNGSVSGDKDRNVSEDGTVKERANHVRFSQKSNGVHDDHSIQKEESYKTLSGHRAGEAAIVYEHGADIEALMPKLWRSDYYTEPRIQELAAKERAEPGFCHHVKDFVVGRHGYGSIKFLGETDVRRLDLESLVQFNNREVIVYMDDSKKPPVGQGLNKPAEVTLLNIKCYDKKTGRQYTEGPKIEKYKEILKKKAEDQGAEFVSYDPVKGEWKFRVSHFSKYELGGEDAEEEGDPHVDGDC